jgi:hypothetical protein
MHGCGSSRPVRLMQVICQDWSILRRLLPSILSERGRSNDDGKARTGGNAGPDHGGRIEGRRGGWRVAQRDTRRGKPPAPSWLFTHVVGNGENYLHQARDGVQSGSGCRSCGSNAAGLPPHPTGMLEDGSSLAPTRLTAGRVA